MDHLITINEIGKLSRPISKHIDEDILTAYIREAEELDIRPAIGDKLFLDILQKPTLPAYKRLLNGKTPDDPYNATFDATFGASGELSYNAGLKTALAYYVLARIIKNNDIQITRFGAVKKDSEYSEKPQREEKRNQYGELCAIADRYLLMCKKYMRRYPKRFPLYAESVQPFVNNRTRYKLGGK